MNSLTGVNIIHNEFGRTFRVRVLTRGSHYGLDDNLIWGEDRIGVEFYDVTNVEPKFGHRGQFVSRYFIDDLTLGQGLALDGGVLVWQLNPYNVQDVFNIVYNNKGGKHV